MGWFWLGVAVALAPSALLIGWLAWLAGVFSEGPPEMGPERHLQDPTAKPRMRIVSS